jgi:hypothetical protein
VFFACKVNRSQNGRALVVMAGDSRSRYRQTSVEIGGKLYPHKQLQFMGHQTNLHRSWGGDLMDHAYANAVALYTWVQAVLQIA